MLMCIYIRSDDILSECSKVKGSVLGVERAPTCYVKTIDRQRNSFGIKNVLICL